MMTNQQTPLSRPTYDRAILKPRLFHIGFGAFAKAHIAVFHDEMLRQTGCDWGVVVSRLNSGADELTALDEADHLFTVGEMADEELNLRQVGAIIKTLHPGRDGVEALLKQIADPDLHVITLTITEKGYCLAGGHLDLKNSAIVGDLANTSAPKSAIGLIVEGLRRRKAAGLPGITILSCDNLPTNGKLCEIAVLEFAEQINPGLKSWISAECRFPSSMVDRITPAMTDEAYGKLEIALGSPDTNAVLCEPFRQWVVEDNFAGEKPAWDVAEAAFVDNVEPYEDLKLRLLNGSHSFLAYLGALSGKETIADCMADETVKKAARKLMLEEQALTLDVPDGFDVAEYASQLIERFCNSALKHKTTQIASDGSQKLPQRLLAPIRTHLASERDWSLAAFAVVGWMLYCRGTSETGALLPLNDPMAARITEIVSTSDGDDYVRNMMHLDTIFGNDLSSDPQFSDAIIAAYQSLKSNGVQRSLADCL